jgi:hypothetical protein
MKAVIEIEFSDERDLAEKTDCVAILLAQQAEFPSSRYFEIVPGKYPIVDIATDLEGQEAELVAHLAIML